MVFFNYSTMQMAAKVVYYGPGLCGKTTNLQWIFDHTSTDSRGEMVSLATETDRTLFFDLLPIDVGTIAGFNTRIQLYTVPGQVFYNTTRKLVLKGVDGVVFVADSQAPMLQANIDSFANLEENLGEMGLNLETIPVVLQYNKRDLPNVLSVEELNKVLNRGDWPYAEASAIQGDGVFETLKLVSKATLLALKKRLTKGRSEGAAPRPGAAPARPSLPKAPLKPPLPPKPSLAKPSIAAPPERAKPLLPRPPVGPPGRPGPLPRVPPPRAPAAGPEGSLAEAKTEYSGRPLPGIAQAGPETAAKPPETAAPAPEAAAGEREMPEVEVELLPDAGEAPPDAMPDEPIFEPLPEPELEVELEPEPVAGAPSAPAAPSETAGAPELPDVVSEPPSLEPAAPELAVPEPAPPEPVTFDEPELEVTLEPPADFELEAMPLAEQVGAQPPEAVATPLSVPRAEPVTPPGAAPAPAVAPASFQAPRPEAAAEPARRRSKSRLGGIDALAELEKLRRQALHPRASRSQRNGQEIRREVEFDLSKSVLQRASRFSITLRLEDQNRQTLDETRQVHVDIEDPSSLEKLLLRFNIALNTTET